MPYRDIKQQGEATLRSKHLKLKWVGALKLKRGCDICGYNKNPVALQYHHTNPSNILKGISRMANSNASKVDILAEISKCTLLCANCHAVQMNSIYMSVA